MKSALSCLVLAVLLLLSVVAAETPSQVHVAFSGKPSEVSVMWRMNNVNLNNPQLIHVQYGTASKKYDKSISGIFKRYIARNYPVNMFEVVLKDLPPLTKIYYRVGSDLSGWSEEYSFITQIVDPKDATGDLKPFPFKILSYGDMDIGSDSRRTQELVYDRLKEEGDNLRFIIHQGDIPYAWSEDKWDVWFDNMLPVTTRVPYMVCPGNHESDHDFMSYKCRFSNITGINSNSKTNLYYSFDYLNTHYIALSTEHPYQAGSEQYTWLENNLAAVDRTRTPFVIVYAHRPMYSSNKNHGSDLQFRRYIEPLFYKYHVDLVLFGHVHAYERSCSMFKGKCLESASTYRNTRGTTLIVAGTAGFELNPHWETKPEWSTYRETRHGILQLTFADWNTIHVEFLRTDRTASSIDRFTLYKDKDALDS